VIYGKEGRNKDMAHGETACICKKNTTVRWNLKKKEVDNEVRKTM
jgi:hypothetical protein